ncbi:MAG: hypothetical protein QM704_25995 [Anaeromyxobacteraceae bacterium]
MQLTRDGGKSWKDVTPPAALVPKASWVSWVEPSRAAAGTAYATFDRHTFGDFDAHLLRTTDFGKTWTRIAGPGEGLKGWAHVVREDPVKPTILYAGTELGLWISVDAGASWARFEGGRFPAVAVRDLAFADREGDLVIATHGRGLWIVDDLAPLRALSTAALGREVTLLPSRPAQQRMNAIGQWVQGDAKHLGQNPDEGAVVAFYQRSRHLYGTMKLEVLDPAGKVVDTIPAPKRRGLNRVSWSMREKAPEVPRAASIAGASMQGPRVVPGTWRVRLTRGAEVVEAPLEIRLDRRAPYDVAARKAQHDAVMRVHALFGRMTAVVAKLDGLAGAARAAAKGAPADRAARLAKLADAAEALKKLVVATKEGGAITGEERLREHADILYGALQTWEGRPAAYQLQRIDALTSELGEVERGLAALVAGEAKALSVSVAAAPSLEDPRALADLLRARRGEVVEAGEDRVAR